MDPSSGAAAGSASAESAESLTATASSSRLKAVLGVLLVAIVTLTAGRLLSTVVPFRLFRDLALELGFRRIVVSLILLGVVGLATRSDRVRSDIPVRRARAVPTVIAAMCIGLAQAMYVRTGLVFASASALGATPPKATGIKWPLWFLVVGVVLLGPVAEEIAFRGYLLGRIEMLAGQRFGTPVAIIVTTALFALAHTPGTGAFAVVHTAPFGLALAMLQVRTRSLIACISAHSIANAVITWLPWNLLVVRWWAP